MSIFSKLFVNFAAEFLTAYVIISVYWSSPVFIQLQYNSSNSLYKVLRYLGCKAKHTKRGQEYLLCARK